MVEPWKQESGGQPESDPDRGAPEEDGEEVEDALGDAGLAAQCDAQEDVEEHDRDAVVEHALALDESEEPLRHAEVAKDRATALASSAEPARTHSGKLMRPSYP